MINKLSKIFSKIDCHKFNTFYRDLSCLSLAVSASNATTSDLIDAVYVIAFGNKPSTHYTFSKNIERIASVTTPLTITQEYLAFKKALKFLPKETANQLVCKTASNRPNFANFEVLIKNSANVPTLNKNANKVNSAQFGDIVEISGKWHLTNPITKKISSLYLSEAGLKLEAELKPFEVVAFGEYEARAFSELSPEEQDKLKQYLLVWVDQAMEYGYDSYESVISEIFWQFNVDLKVDEFNALTGMSPEEYESKILEMKGANNQENITSASALNKNIGMDIFVVAEGKDLETWDPFAESQGMKEIEQVSLTKPKEEKPQVNHFSAKDMAQKLSSIKNADPEKYSGILANLSTKLTGKDAKAFDFVLALEKAGFDFMEATRLDGEFSTHASYQDLLKNKVLPILEKDPAYSEFGN